MNASHASCVLTSVVIAAGFVVCQCSSSDSPAASIAEVDASSADDRVDEDGANATTDVPLEAAPTNDGGNDVVDAFSDEAADGQAEGEAGPPVPQLLVDTDMGLDDARVMVSLPMQGKYHVAAVVTVEGTAGATKGADNALRLLHALGVDNIPVAIGATTTFAGNAVPAPSWRGMAESLGGLSLAAASRQVETVGGVEFERALLRDATHPVDVLAIGPVSNLALVLSQEPSLASKVGAVYLLGDFDNCVGYNCTTDAQAADVIAQAGIPRYMLLAAQTNNAPFNAAFLSSVQALQGPAAQLVAGFMASHADGYMKLWDDGVLASMLEASVANYDGAGRSTDLDVDRLHQQLLGLWDEPVVVMP